MRLAYTNTVGAALLAGTLLAISTAWAAAAEPERIVYSHEPTGLRFPALIGDFEEEGLTRHADKSLGVTIRYAATGKTVLYAHVYPAPAKILPPPLKGPLSDPLQTHYADLKKRIQRMAEEGRYTDLQRRGEERFEVPVQTAPVGLKATYALVRDGERMRSQLILFVLRQHFVKFRVTYPEADHRMAEAATAGFLASLSWPATAPSQTEVSVLIGEFLADPLGRKQHVSAITQFAKESDSVEVLVRPEILNWTRKRRQARHSDLLVCAYVAGNVRAQLARGKVEMAKDSHAGILAAIEVYGRLQEQDSTYQVPELNEYRQLADAAKLERHIQLQLILFDRGEDIRL